MDVSSDLREKTSLLSAKYNMEEPVLSAELFDLSTTVKCGTVPRMPSNWNGRELDLRSVTFAIPGAQMSIEFSLVYILNS